MLIVKCTQCGETYAGWLLSNPEHCKCPRCGGDLVVSNDDTGLVDNQQSLLSAEEYQPEDSDIQKL